MNTITFNGQQIAPAKVVCIGRNYVEHITELGNEMPGEPVIFNKPNSAISTQLFASSDGQLHYEGELAFLIEQGRLAGVGFGLDLTRRDVQAKLKAKGLPWERAKAFDHSAVFSEFVPFDASPSSLRIELYINATLVQHGGYEHMIHKPQDIVAHVSTFMTIADGDILMTGTPQGVGSFAVGDEFSGRVFAGDTLLVEKYWKAQGGGVSNK